MSEQENIKIVRKTIDNLNSHNLDANDMYVSNNIRVEASGASGVLNMEQGKMYNRRFLDAFPDLHFDLKNIIAQGDMVAAFWVAKGTHKAPLQTLTGDSIPATNRTVSLPGCTYVEVRDNKIVRQEIYWDQVSFLTQLGILTERELTYKVQR